MPEFNISVMPGDGIGPEIMEQALRVLDKIAKNYSHKFNYKTVYIGGCSIDKFGKPITSDTIATVLSTDALLFSAVGGEKWDNLPQNMRPEAGLLEIRKAISGYANIRPIKVFPAMETFSTLKAEVISGIDIVIVRELVSGIYFGEPRGVVKLPDGVRKGFNTMSYKDYEIERIAKVAFSFAQKRRKKITSIDKANVLDVSTLWRDVVSEVHKDYPDVALDFMYVDNAAMQLVRNPSQFDVILAGNIFGDILSDEASMITGSLGMLPSAAIGGNVGMFEPVHGSAPDIAGKAIANPVAQIVTTAMMLRYGLGLEAEANAIENAVDKTLEKGYRTPDIFKNGNKKVDTIQMGDAIIEEI
ncbi:MAG: 3-isopropylmalate dehydrogenase [bacterium]|nr:MAG: 3-isopropylmalate dehydrogenase [bacterium]